MNHATEVTGLGVGRQTEVHLREAFAKVQRTHGGSDVSIAKQMLRNMAAAAEPPEERILLRLVELLEQDACLANLATLPVGHAEPIFVLRAQDIIAAPLVAQWAFRLQQAAGATHQMTDGRIQKAADVLKLAAAFAKWPKRKLPD